MEREQIYIACVLTALSREERKRENVLLDEHLSSVLEMRERPDGYSFRYPPEVGLFARMAELVALEHRCCPFLDFQLEWQGGDAQPWIHITGGALAKEFVLQTFAPDA